MVIAFINLFYPKSFLPNSTQHADSELVKLPYWNDRNVHKVFPYCTLYDDREASKKNQSSNSIISFDGKYWTTRSKAVRTSTIRLKSMFSKTFLFTVYTNEALNDERRQPLFDLWHRTSLNSRRRNYQRSRMKMSNDCAKWKFEPLKPFLRFCHHDLAQHACQFTIIAAQKQSDSSIATRFEAHEQHFFYAAPLAFATFTSSSHRKTITSSAM